MSYSPALRQQHKARYTTIGTVYLDWGTEHVPGEGNDENPFAFVVGEAPGAQEAMRKRPFVGPAGIVLRRFMDKQQLWADRVLLHGTPGSEELYTTPNVWLTNVLKFRPAGNRTPTTAEINAVRPILRDEYFAVGAPPVIVCVGRTALEAVTRRQLSIVAFAGQPMELRKGKHADATCTVWPMLHPAACLRNPALRNMAEKDWQRLGDWIVTHANFL